MLLYRYYSPWFDNALGYAFSESSRIGDENGAYVAFDIKRVAHWRFNGYADFFYFSGRKYGIGYAPSLGYDCMLETRYQPTSQKYMTLRLRAREKGSKATYSARLQWNMQDDYWSIRTTAEANITQDSLSLAGIETEIPFSEESGVGYGFTLYQDFMFDFQNKSFNHPIPMSLHLRLQGFCAPKWDNRIYCYEHDVLYAYSVPALYGRGVRAYICLRWQIIKQLALYLRVSETVYDRDWFENHYPSNTIPAKTDIHVLLRSIL